MYKETAKLVLYRSFGEHSILAELSQIFRDFDSHTVSDAELIERIYARSKLCLTWRQAMASNENLWH